MLEASDSASGDNFGCSLSLQESTNTLLVGASSAGAADQGAVYIFSYDGSSWAQAAGLLLASDGATEDGFGSSVALSADGVLAVGAPGVSSNTGVVYMFDQSQADSGSFTETVKVQATAGQQTDFFGAALALHGTRLMVGSPLARDAANERSGLVYQFDYAAETWSQTTALQLSGAELLFVIVHTS